MGRRGPVAGRAEGRGGQSEVTISRISTSMVVPACERDAKSAEPEVPYNPDIAPDGSMTLERHRLLADAVQALGVFGSMGSWMTSGFWAGLRRKA